jgi:hypothetical protein
MFYSVAFSAKDKDGAPVLRHCWLCSHGKALSRKDLSHFSIEPAARLIIEPIVALSLRYATSIACVLAQAMPYLGLLGAV